MAIELSLKSLATIRLEGETTYPHECCGFLVGSISGGKKHVVDVIPANNAREEDERRNRYAIAPRAYLECEHRARKMELDIIGFYHSHPNAAPQPSAYDTDHAWPWFSYLIVSVNDGRAAEHACWVLEEDRSRFNEEPITVND